MAKMLKSSSELISLLPFKIKINKAASPTLLLDTWAVPKRRTLESPIFTSIQEVFSISLMVIEFSAFILFLVVACYINDNFIRF